MTTATLALDVLQQPSLMQLCMCRAVMAMCRAEWLPQSTLGTTAGPADGHAVENDAGCMETTAATLALDGNALANLEVNARNVSLGLLWHGQNHQAL